MSIRVDSMAFLVVCGCSDFFGKGELVMQTTGKYVGNAGARDVSGGVTAPPRFVGMEDLRWFKI
jgi:hypothetical protein